METKEKTKKKKEETVKIVGVVVETRHVKTMLSDIFGIKSLVSKEEEAIVMLSQKDYARICRAYRIGVITTLCMSRFLRSEYAKMSDDSLPYYRDLRKTADITEDEAANKAVHFTDVMKEAASSYMPGFPIDGERIEHTCDILMDMVEMDKYPEMFVWLNMMSANIIMVLSKMPGFEKNIASFFRIDGNLAKQRVTAKEYVKTALPVEWIYYGKKKKK